MFFDDNKREQKKNLHLDIQYTNLLSNFENEKEKRIYFEKEFNKLKGVAENMCKSLLSNKYTYNQLGGNNILQSMDIYKLLHFTNMDIQEQRIKQLELIQSLNSQIQDLTEIVKTLQEQLTYAMLNTPNDLTEEEVLSANSSNIIDNTGMLEEINIEPPKKVEYKRDISSSISKNNKIDSIFYEKPQVNYEKPKPTTIPKTQQEDKMGFIPNLKNNNIQKPNNPLVNTNNSEQNQSLTLEKVDSYKAVMTETMWDIVKAIGEKGFSKSNDIIDYIMDIKPSTKKSSISPNLTTLKKMNVLNVETVSTGYRRFNLYKLTSKGITMYKEEYGCDIVENEMNLIIKQHDNIQHGYTIKDTVELLLKYHNCTEAIMDRTQVSIKLPNGKTYIPDIIATNQKGEKMFIEVELGNTPQKDFNDKCSKMLEVTNKFYIITDSDTTIKDKLEKQVASWILMMGGKEKVEGLTIYLSSTKRLEKGDFSRVLKY